MSRPLRSDVALGVHLSAICSRNRYTRNPDPLIAELLEAAGDRGDVLAYEAGRWAGYYDDEHTAVLVAAIMRDIPGAAEWALSAGRDGQHPRTGRRDSGRRTCRRRRAAGNCRVKSAGNRVVAWVAARIVGA